MSSRTAALRPSGPHRIAATTRSRSSTGAWPFRSASIIRRRRNRPAAFAFLNLQSWAAVHLHHEGSAVRIDRDVHAHEASPESRWASAASSKISSQKGIVRPRSGVLRVRVIRLRRPRQTEWMIVPVESRTAGGDRPQVQVRPFLRTPSSECASSPWRDSRGTRSRGHPQGPKGDRSRSASCGSMSSSRRGRIPLVSTCSRRRGMARAWASSAVRSGGQGSFHMRPLWCRGRAESLRLRGRRPA